MINLTATAGTTIIVVTYIFIIEISIILLINNINKEIF